jgi:glycosyltransferase involved in cell wall biosynthesis
MNGEDDPSQMSLTFSGEFAEFCQESRADAYIVASNANKQLFRNGNFVIEHRPKHQSRGGIFYHLSEICYGIGLLKTALRHRAEAAVLCSGTTHYFVMALFRLAGMQVIPVMHNTLWPSGSPPTRAMRFIMALDRYFFRWSATSLIGVSPECLRQVHQITEGKHCPAFEMKAQFRRKCFETMPGVPPHDRRPFRILFAGRIIEEKGIFDLLEIARAVAERAPGCVAWEICGGGPDLDELRKRHHEMNLGSIVTIHGWTPPAKLREVMGKSHLSVVPTRSDFAEGMAMTVIEAILAGRPVVTSPVVPALEVVRSACVEAKTNCVESYVEAILRVLRDGAYYRELCNACPSLAEQFYDRRLGFRAALHKAMNTNSKLKKLAFS